MRLAVATSHPIQYYAPLFRELAGRVDLEVFYAHRATPEQQAAAGFGAAFDWDVDLTGGYAHRFLTNVSKSPGTDRFGGCDTPEIGERLAEGRFDALLVFGWNLKSSVQAALAAKRLGLPVLVRGDSQLATQRSPLKRLVKAATYPSLLRLFDAALYVGQRSRAYYRHYGYPEQRLFFSPHCVDNRWFAEHAGPEARARQRAEIGAGPDERLVLFAGKLVDFKRPLDVVEAVAALADPTVRVMVAGSGAWETAMRERADALGVRLDLLGFRNQSQMPAAYAAADVLMLPSDGRETWGLVCNEALACGTSILVSDQAGCADDLAAPGEAGVRYPMGDVAAAAGRLRELLASPPDRAALAATSSRYSLAAAADGVIGATDALAQRRLRR